MQLQRRYDVEIDTALREAMRDAVARVDDLDARGGIGNVVRSAQLMATLSEIAGALSAFWNRAGDVIRAGQAEAIRVALEKSFEWDAPLLSTAGVGRTRRTGYRDWLLDPARFNLEAMLHRDGQQPPLARQVYRTSALAQGWVERRISSAIARGEPVAQLAREVRDFINPATPGGATYAARRLARTEINAAYHATTIYHNADKPWNEGIRWALSRSHPKQDECDIYAQSNHSGLGPGVFPRTAVPRKPHPMCLCFSYPETVSPTEFVAAYRRGAYDEWMRLNYGA